MNPLPPVPYTPSDFHEALRDRLDKAAILPLSKVLFGQWSRYRQVQLPFVVVEPSSTDGSFEIQGASNKGMTGAWIEFTDHGMTYRADTVWSVQVPILVSAFAQSDGEIFEESRYSANLRAAWVLGFRALAALKYCVGDRLVTTGAFRSLPEQTEADSTVTGGAGVQFTFMLGVECPDLLVSPMLKADKIDAVRRVVFPV